MLTFRAAEPAKTPAGLPVDVLLPLGLVGFPRYTHFRLEAAAEGPFCWLMPAGDDAPDVCFLVLEAAGWIPGYELELFDEDADWLRIRAADEVRVFNIVKLDPEVAGRGTVNLVGPVLVRRDGAWGKQVILSNHQRYSAEHPLGTAAAAR